MTPSTEAPRQAHWDALRGVALLAVVALHACGPYLSRPLPGLLWPVSEKAATTLPMGERVAFTDAVFWACRAFAVPLFCFVAGALSIRSLAAAGPAAFARRRAARLGPPLLAGTLIVLPLMYAIWCAGWVRMGWTTWPRAAQFRLDPALRRGTLGLAHYWYLWYTLLYSLILAGAWRFLAPGRPRSAPARPPPPEIACGLLVVALGGACVWAMPSSLLVFVNGYVPAPGFFLYHGLFFLWGALSAQGATERLAPHRTVPPRVWPATGLTLAGVACSAALPALAAPVMLTLANQPPPTTATDTHRLAAGACATLAAVLMISGLSRLLHAGPPRWVCGLGRASLWLYATHLPWVGLAAVLLSGVSLPPEAKAAAAFIAGLGLPLLTHGPAGRWRAGRWLGALPPPAQA